MAHHILICLPTYSEEVHVNFAFSLLDLTRAITDAGSTYQTMHVASSQIIRARNFFANYLLNRPEFTHLLFLDTDMRFPAAGVMRLLAADKAIAGLAYPFRKMHLDQPITVEDSGLTVRQLLEKYADFTVAPLTDDEGNVTFKGGFIEAEHVGTGVFLAKREAFEATIPFTECFAPPTQYASMLPNDAFYGFFETVEHNRVYQGEDISFCRRARQAGMQIFALIDETVVHYGMSEVSGQWLQSMKLRGNIL